MKSLIAAGLFAVTTPVIASALQFSDADLSIVVLPDPPMLRKGSMVTFAAESTLKTRIHTDLPAGSKMTVIWTVDCRKNQFRLVLAGLNVPGRQPITVSRDEMIALAKKESFSLPKDEIAKQIVTAVCS